MTSERLTGSQLWQTYANRPDAKTKICLHTSGGVGLMSGAAGGLIYSSETSGRFDR